VAREVGLAFAREAGCAADAAACLRALPAKRILDMQQPHALNEFIIDGAVLPVHPADAYRTGRINHATLVSGSTRDEGTFFVALSELLTERAMTDADYPAWLARQYGPALAPKFLLEYPLARFESPSEAFAAAATDSIFACPGRAMHRALAGKMPVYAYEFSDRTAPSYVGPTTFPLKAAHTYELAYLFPGFRGGADVTISLNPLQEKLSDEMIAQFSDLAGMPARPGQWPRVDPAVDNVMTFDLPSARIVTGRFAQVHRCAFWDRTGSY